MPKLSILTGSWSLLIRIHHSDPSNEARAVSSWTLKIPWICPCQTLTQNLSLPICRHLSTRFKSPKGSEPAIKIRGKNVFLEKIYLKLLNLELMEAVKPPLVLNFKQISLILIQVHKRSIKKNFNFHFSVLWSSGLPDVRHILNHINNSWSQNVANKSCCIFSRGDKNVRTLDHG